MDRAGERSTSLTPDEMSTIFELASVGRGQEEAFQRLERDRTTINRAYNVVLEFELRELTRLDDATATQIAESAKYRVTVTRVKDLFLQWRMWKRGNEPKELTYVRAAAALIHAGKLRSIAQEFGAQLRLPRPQDAGSWFPPQGKRHGIVAVSTGSEPVGSRPSYTWSPREAGPRRLRLRVEEDLYFTCLRGHVSDDRLWCSFDQWKTDGAMYLDAGDQLVQTIVTECQRRTGSSILIPKEWSQEGVFWTFARQLYEHHTSVVIRTRAVDGLGYDFKEQSSGEPVHGVVYELWRGSTGIARHRDLDVLDVLKEWKKTFESILQIDKWRGRAKNIRMHLKDEAGPVASCSVRSRAGDLRQVLLRGTVHSESGGITSRTSRVVVSLRNVAPEG